jgi:hypothetical protein
VSCTVVDPGRRMICLRRAFSLNSGRDEEKVSLQCNVFNAMKYNTFLTNIIQKAKRGMGDEYR